MEGNNEITVRCCRQFILSTLQHLRGSGGTPETERECLRAKGGVNWTPVQGQKGATTNGRDQVALHVVSPFANQRRRNENPRNLHARNVGARRNSSRMLRGGNQAQQV